MLLFPPELAVGLGFTVTTALPLMVAEQLVAATVATTVYDPAAVLFPKLIADPVPATAEPLFTLFSRN
jgi:hypothetical protein